MDIFSLSPFLIDGLHQDMCVSQGNPTVSPPPNNNANDGVRREREREREREERERERGRERRDGRYTAAWRY